MRRMLTAATAAALAVLGAPGLGEAQPAARTPRIGILFPPFEELGVGTRLRTSLTGRGWVEGANLRIESRTAWAVTPSSTSSRRSWRDSRWQ